MEGELENKNIGEQLIDRISEAVKFLDNLYLIQLGKLESQLKNEQDTDELNCNRISRQKKFLEDELANDKYG